MQESETHVKVYTIFYFHILVYAQTSHTIAMALRQCLKGQPRVEIKTFEKCLEGCPIVRRESASFH